MQRLPGLIRTSIGGSVLRTPHPFWLLERKATVCSVCSALVKRARLQKILQQQQQLGKLRQPLSEIHLPHKQQLQLLLPTARRLQHTTHHSSNDPRPTTSSPQPPANHDGSHHVAWGYTGHKGVDHWAELLPTSSCGGQSQSPVNIDTSATEFDDSLTPFDFLNFDQTNDIDWVLQNNGHAAQVTYLNGDLFVSGGGLDSKYKVVQFHFHWGASDTLGSEHTVDGLQSPMEMHIVTYNTDHGSLENALGHDDGLAVLGAFFKVDTANNTDFDGLIDALRAIQVPGTQISFPTVELKSLMPSTDEFCRYSGSLTTPPCSEIVTWTLFRHPVPISSSQLSEFRTLTTAEGTPLVNNFRPVQPLNGRKIKCNY